MNLIIKKLAMVVGATVFALAVHAEATTTFTGWLTTEDQLVWKNVELKYLWQFHGTLGGKSGLNGCTDGPAYFTENSGAVATMQFQHLDGTTLKGVVVQFTQVGGDVYGKILKARYKEKYTGIEGGADITGIDFFNTDITSSSGSYGYGVHDLYATINTPTTYTADTSAASWSQIDNWSPSSFVQGPWSSAVLNLGGDNFDFDADGMVAKSVAITSANDLTLTASKVPTGVPLYDLSDTTGKTILNFDPGASTVRAGSATYAGVASTEATYVVASGKRLYVSDPTTAGKMKITQEGILGYTGTFDITATPQSKNGEGLEYAGTHTLSAFVGDCVKPLYFSGTITMPHDKEFVRSTSSDLHIIGGETLLKGKTLLSHSSNSGANITISGGVLKGDQNPTSDPYIYWGGWNGTISLAVKGTGRWEAAIKPYGKSGSIGKYNVTITVSEQGVFAPSALAFNEGSDTAASGTCLVMQGGTFEMPASVPYWLPEEVVSGVATNVISADTEMKSPLVVAEGATLVVRSSGPQAKLTLTGLSGKGKVIADGVTLDLLAVDFTALGGTTFEVKNGGTLKGVYLGNENFYNDRAAIPEASALLAGTHKYGIDKRMSDAKGTFKGLTFCGNVTLENKSGNPEFMVYTRTDEPLNIVGGIFDGGNVMLAPCHEESNSKTYAINLSNDGVLTNMRLRWGYYWKSQTTMTLKDSSSFTGSLTPMKAKATDWKEDSTFTVNIEDSATFAPTALCAENGTSSDTVSGPCFINLNSANATFVLPEAVPSWAKTTLNAGMVSVRESEKVAIAGDVTVNDAVAVTIPANGTIKIDGTLTGAEKLKVSLAGSHATIISPVELTNVSIAEGVRGVRLATSQKDGKYIYRAALNGIVILMY